MNYWDKAECISKEERRELQSRRLSDTVKRVYANVPYYAKRMEEAGLAPEDIRGVDDLARLPFSRKADLRDHYPYGTFAVPTSEVVRVHASSGTTGKPIVVGYTAQDLDMWSDCVARAMTSLQIDQRDVIHVSYGYGLFTGGLGINGGAEKIHALTVPASTGNTKRQIQLLGDLGATVICCTPSYALYIIDEMKKHGISRKSLKLKTGIFGAEPWTEEMRQNIEENLGIKAYDIYGLSEIAGPGVACDCAAKNGMHVQSDHFIPEIINPKTGEVLPMGETGELVFTCISKQALPLIRYRTGDLCSLDDTPCACGRTTPRMGKIKGRADDMLIIRGVNVFPSQIETVILRFKEIEPHYMIYVDRVNNTDTLDIDIEMNDSLFSDKISQIQNLERALAREIQSTLGIGADIHLVQPNTIPRSEGKAKRVVDKRALY